jgi:hypothetical protein
MPESILNRGHWRSVGPRLGKGWNYVPSAPCRATTARFQYMRSMRWTERSQPIVAPLRSTTHPNYVRLDLPLIRSRDRQAVGTLILIRNYSWTFYDDEGRRFAVPQLADMIAISLTGPDGELVSWQEVPAMMLLYPQHE